MNKLILFLLRSSFVLQINSRCTYSLWNGCKLIDCAQLTFLSLHIMRDVTTKEIYLIFDLNIVLFVLSFELAWRKIKYIKTQGKKRYAFVMLAYVMLSGLLIKRLLISGEFVTIIIIVVNLFLLHKGHL